MKILKVKNKKVYKFKSLRRKEKDEEMTKRNNKK